jgi:uncharacterized membrane protein YkvA (DUF1232 family)
MNSKSETQIEIPATQPLQTFTYTRIVEIPPETPFPQSLVSFRTYNSWKILSLFVLTFALCGFAFSIVDPFLHPDKYTEAIVIEIDNRGIVKKGWDWFYSTMWQNTPKETKIVQDASQRITWNRTCGFATVVLSWLFVWMSFDWRNAKRRVYCIFLVGFGIGYAIAPIDIIPDVIPFLGQIDDIMIALFGVGLGISSLAEDFQKRKEAQDITEIIKEHPESGLRLLLKRHGLTVKRHEDKQG